jgi:hypothetical protein
VSGNNIDMPSKSRPKQNIQLIWGIALLLMGIAVFVRIPQVMPEIAKIEQFSGITGFIRICFYIMGIILVGGGIKKLLAHFNITQESEQSDSTDDDG